MAGNIYVARQSTFLVHNGEQVHIKAGITRVREGHPILESRPGLFREIEVHFDLEDERQAPQDEPKPEPVKRSTKQPESHQATASHEGPASIGASHGGQASEGPASDKDGSSKSSPAVDDDEYFAPAATKGPAKKTAPRRGPRKTGS